MIVSLHDIARADKDSYKMLLSTDNYDGMKNRVASIGEGYSDKINGIFYNDFAESKKYLVEYKFVE